MKARDIRQLSETELLMKIAEEEENLTKMRFQLTSSQLPNTANIRATRREIARMKTVLHERQLQSESK